MSGVEAAVGIAASGAGLLSLSIQLVESAAKLKKIYHAARDAPRTIARLQHSLETIALALQQLEQRRQQGSATDALLARCIAECELHTADIQELVDKMDDRLSGDAKIGGRLYIAFKQRDVKELLDGLEKAKSSLELAYMMYLGEEQRRRDQAYTDMLAIHGTLISGLQAQLSAGNASLSQQLTLLGQSSVLSPQHRPMIFSTQTGNTNTATARGPVVAGFLQTETTEIGVSNVQVIHRASQCERSFGIRGVKRKNNKPRFRATFRFPSWLTTRIFDFAATQAQCGWSIHLRTFNQVPGYSPILRYCQNGNLEGIRRLLETGKATPLDAVLGGWRSLYDGCTLIEAAAGAGQLEVCRFLLSQTTWLDHERLSSALCNYSLRIHSQDAEMYRLFLTDPGFEVYTDLDDIGRCTWLENCVNMDNLEIVLQNQLPGFDSGSLEARFELALQLPLLDAADFMRFVGLYEPLDPRFASLRSSRGRSVLHYVATKDFLRNQGWFDIGLSALKSGADPSSIAASQDDFGHDPDGWQATPLLDFLNIHNWQLHNSQTALDRIHTWAEMIQRAGLDLWEYGEHESEVWRALGVQNGSGLWKWPAVVVQLVYGPTPANWSLIIDQPWKINVYELQQPPGAFGDDPRLPTEIAWVPTQDEEDEGPWIFIERKERVTKDVDLRDLLSDQRDTFFDLVDDSQDDSGVIMMMQYRASRATDGTRMRSRSQPPCLSRRGRAYKYSHILHRSQWLQYHLCPLDSRWRLGCVSRWYEGPFIPGMEIRGSVVDERSCLKGTCSRSPPSAQETWGWYTNSFLARIADCQDENSYNMDWDPTPQGLRHTFTRNCPQGCKNVDIGRLNVPEPLRSYHPSRSFVEEDEDGCSKKDFNESKY
ncbi:hypothetical protein CLAIMM_08781 [Cladophialophora immunda]|nr:hypothetical protein CLAIMM_08781 [Cladophialophora immunda]